MNSFPYKENNKILMKSYFHSFRVFSALYVVKTGSYFCLNFCKYFAEEKSGGFHENGQCSYFFFRVP